jgi:hypothetical protein
MSDEFRLTKVVRPKSAAFSCISPSIGGETPSIRQSLVGGSQATHRIIFQISLQKQGLGGGVSSLERTRLGRELPC